MKLVSWNVNGIRAIIQKNFSEDFHNLNADVLCIQETKAQDDQVRTALESVEGYFLYSNSAEKKGYSGTAVLSRVKPLSVRHDMGLEEHDKEGRVLCLEFSDFYLVTVYVPNSGSDLKRLNYRQSWDMAFFEYLKNLEKTKPVVACGDFNVAHHPIDLARPKPNYNKSAGFMQEEIDGMDRYTSGGLIDSFRHFNPEKEGSYTWWSYRAGARPKNIGWRIDYFLVSEKFMTNVKSADILPDVMGSDHCPVALELY